MFTEDILSNKKKPGGGASQSLLPLLLVGSLGVGSGGVGSTYFAKPSVTQEQHRAQIERVLDKVESLEERLQDKLERLEDEIEELKYEQKNRKTEAAVGRIEAEWPSTNSKGL